MIKIIITYTWNNKDIFRNNYCFDFLKIYILNIKINYLIYYRYR